MAAAWPQQTVFLTVWLQLWSCLCLAGFHCWSVVVVAVGFTSLYLTDLVLKTYDVFGVERKHMKNVFKRGVLITGCDTGFGNQLSNRLSRMGFQVYAGCLHPDGDGAKELSKNGRIKVVQMDVTKQEDIDNVYSIVKEDLKQNGLELWAIVNNAGIGLAGEVEFVSLQTYRRVMEVNVFAPVLVTKTFLPLLRAAQRGRVINVASQAGRFTPVGLSSYAMSKRALISFSDGLRLEMKKWNISVHTIEPILYKTNMINEDEMRVRYEKAWENAGGELQKAYGKAYWDSTTRDAVRQINSAKSVDKVYEVIDDLVDAVAAINPKPCYIPGTDAKMSMRLLSEAPFELQDAFWLWHCDTARPAAAP